MKNKRKKVILIVSILISILIVTIVYNLYLTNKRKNITVNDIKTQLMKTYHYDSCKTSFVDGEYRIIMKKNGEETIYIYKDGVLSIEDSLEIDIKH